MGLKANRNYSKWTGEKGNELHFNALTENGAGIVPVTSEVTANYGSEVTFPVLLLLLLLFIRKTTSATMPTVCFWRRVVLNP